MKIQAFCLLLAVATPAVAQCTLLGTGTIDPSPPGCNFSATTFPIGFAFPFDDGSGIATFTDFAYSDHGCVSLHNGGATPVPAIPLGGVQVYDPGAQPNTALTGGGFAGFLADMIYVYWGDHVGATMHIDNTSGTYCTITWIDTEAFGGGGTIPVSCQVTLYATGVIKIKLDDRCMNHGSSFGPITTVVGISADGVPIPPETDLTAGALVSTSATVYEEFTGPGPVATNTPDPLFDLGGTIITFTPVGGGLWLSDTAPLVCAATATVGTGCGGMGLTSATTPVLGQSWDLAITGGGVADFIAFGNETTATPVGVLFPNLFAPTCNSYMDAAFGVLSAGAPTSIPIPLAANLCGLVMTAQGMALVAAPTPLILSNAETATVGY
tara:strand:- start:64037 stop:65182 length:1146 start_codon:yes stop_codon:yes gene_type:complete